MFRQRQLPPRRVRTHQMANQIEVCFEDRLTRVSWIRDRSRVRLTNKRSSASQNSPRLRSRSQTKAVKREVGFCFSLFPLRLFNREAVRSSSPTVPLRLRWVNEQPQQFNRN